MMISTVNQFILSSCLSFNTTGMLVIIGGIVGYLEISGCFNKARCCFDSLMYLMMMMMMRMMIFWWLITKFKQDNKDVTSNTMWRKSRKTREQRWQVYHNVTKIKKNKITKMVSLPQCFSLWPSLRSPTRGPLFFRHLQNRDYYAQLFQTLAYNKYQLI